MENYLYSLYQMILQSLTFYLGVDQEKKKAGRPPKVSDLQLCALFILSYITNTPVFTLAKSLIDPNIKSYHLFRKTKTQKVYRLLKEYRNRRILSILFAKMSTFGINRLGWLMAMTLREFLLHKGYEVSIEAIREWFHAVGRALQAVYTTAILVYVDETEIKARDGTYYLWLAVDEKGLPVFVHLSRRRDAWTAKRDLGM